MSQGSFDRPSPRPVFNEFRCVSCGYVLRGVAIDQPCPECGTPVAHSIGSRPSSGHAVASLVLGVLAFFTCGLVLGPLAIYFGAKARKQIDTGLTDPGSKGIATAGYICGIIATAIWGAFALFYVAAIVLAVITSP